MQDRPTASELLEAIGDLLEGPLLEATNGALKHQVRVAGNLCRILGREVELAPHAERRELQLLAELLNVDPAGRDSAELSRELSGRLRAGSDSELEERAWPALLEIVRAKLAIAKPGHDDYDFRAESNASNPDSGETGSGSAA